MFTSRAELQRQALRYVNAKKAAAEAALRREHHSHGAPRPPSSAPGIADDGRGALSTGIDGMTLDHASYVARLAALGIDLPPGYEVHARPPPTPIAPEVAFACFEAQDAAERHAEEIAALLEEGRIDGKEATPEEAMARLCEMGLDPGHFPADLFRSEGALLPPPPDVEHTRRIAEEAALRSVSLRIARGEPIDALSLTPDEARAYKRARGVSGEGWEAQPGNRAHE